MSRGKIGKDLRYNYVALLLCAVACCGWSYVLDLKYYRLGYTSWDLPLYANLMWHLCHGSLSTSLFEGNFLTDHFNVIAFALVPFYYFFQSALTMLYFKLFAFFAGAYIFYLLTAKRLGGLWGIAFMLAYMFYPANVAMIFFEFNFENLALPLIFLLFYYFEEKKFLSFMVCCFLLTTVKENMPLVVFMFGIYGLMTRKEDRVRWGLYPMFLGFVMFMGEVFVAIPLFRPALDLVNQHLNMYFHLGHAPREIVRTLIFDESKVFRALFSSSNASFLLQLFGPLLMTALLAPKILLIASPLFLQDLLSKFPGQHSIYFFYSSTLTVFIFMATIDSLGRITIKFKGHLLLLIIGLLFAFNLWHIPRWIERLSPFQEKQLVSHYFLSQIPPDAQVVASYKFLYMLSQRKGLYVLSSDPRKLSLQKEIFPGTVDYMMVDFNTVYSATRAHFRERLRDDLFYDPWTVQAAADEVVLLRKNAPRGEKLIEWGEHSLSLAKPLQPVMADYALKTEGVEVPRFLKFDQRIMRVVFYWESLKDDENRNLPPIYLSIFQGGKMFYSKDRPPFYGLPFLKGLHGKAVFYYFIPRLSPGDYVVVISSAPPSRRNSLQASSANVSIKNISVLLN